MYVHMYVCMCVVLKMHLMYVLDEKVEEHIARVQANCNMFAWAPVDLEEVTLLHLLVAPVDLEEVICVCMYHALCAFLLRGMQRRASS